MNPIEIYKACVAAANAETVKQFGEHGPYEPGTEQHTFWLAAFDRAWK